MTLTLTDTTTANSYFTRTGYTVSGWTTTDGSAQTHALAGSFTTNAATTLYPVWSGNQYIVTYAYESATAGNSTASSTFTVGGSAISLPTPTRTSFTLEGWYDASSGGSRVAGAGETLTVTTSRTLFARWTQNSLYGIPAASLTRFGTVTSTGAIDVDVTGRNATSRVAATVPAGALPNGTIINFDLLGDFSRAQTLLGTNKNYVVSMVVSWLALDGTVPNTAAGKEISITVTNNLIKTGASIYAIINNAASLLGTATQDGTVTFSLASDPEVVIVAPALNTPTITAKATSGQVRSIDLSWAAISNVSSYTVKVYNAAGTSLLETITSITGTSLTITTSNFAALSEKSAYKFSVTAVADGASYSNSTESTKVSAATGSLSLASLIGSSAFEGRALSAVTTTLPSTGGWSSYTYQWFGGSDTATLSAISTATLASYTPKASDRSYTNQMYLALEVKTSLGGVEYTFTSTAVPVYTYPNATGGSVTSDTAGTYLSGKYKVGQTVYGHPWSIMGTPWPTLTYQWWICNTSAATATPSASGCTASTSGTSTRAGGYDFSYVVPSTAAGKFLTFTASLSNAATTAQGSAFTLTQSRTMNSGVINTIPTIDTTPEITGTFSVGKKLTAQTVSVNSINTYPTGKITYQWVSSSDVAGPYAPITNARSTTYTPVGADLNKYLKVIATATNTAGDTATATSATARYIYPAYAIASGMTVSLGTSPSQVVGQTLTATVLAPIAGFPASYTYTYQWQRCTNATPSVCSNIASATSASYRTTTSDLSKYVQVLVKATNDAGTTPTWVTSSNRAGPIRGS